MGVFTSAMNRYPRLDTAQTFHKPVDNSVEINMSTEAAFRLEFQPDRQSQTDELYIIYLIR